MGFVSDGTIGVNLTITDTAARFALGTMVEATDGQQYCYVQASGAIVQYHVVAINNAFTATAITTANVANSMSVGVAQVAIAASSYGWVAVRGGNLQALFDATTDIDLGKPLAAGNAAGTFMLYSTATQIKIAGALATATVSGNTSVTANVTLAFGTPTLNI